MYLKKRKYTVKPVYNDDTRDPKLVAVVKRLLNGGRCRQVVVIRRWLLSQVLLYAVKPVYNDHPRDPKIVAVVARWSLFRGHSCNKSTKWDHKMMVVVDRWSLAEV